MLRKRIKGSLTLRIFLITCLILLAASGMTFGITAWATPITYSSIVTTEFEDRSRSLAAALKNAAFADSGVLLDAFIMETGGSVMITDEKDVIVQTPSTLAISAIYEDDTSMIAMSPSGVDMQINVYSDAPLHTGLQLFESMSASNHNDSTWTVTTSAQEWYFQFADRDEVYRLYVSPPIVRSNQTLEALTKIAPGLLGLMLLFSVLCALFYSRWITRPIVELSEISERMAGLDFSQKNSESRQDEIGVLGRNLNELSERLSAALTGLQDANAALRQDIDRERELERQRLAFFSAASHELKTPVTILKGQLSGMLERVDVYQDRDKYLAKSLQVAGRMEGLVQEILTVSRMEANGFALQVRQIDLAELVRGQLALYEDLIFQKELHVRAELPETAPVAADPALLQKVLDNLLSNAVFYAPDGAELSAALTLEGGTVLVIENSGSHIPEEALPHVFEAFYRADASRNRRTGGSGLGLYIVKMILERHGAEYRIENTDSGVRFTIRFA